MSVSTPKPGYCLNHPLTPVFRLKVELHNTFWHLHRRMCQGIANQGWLVSRNVFMVLHSPVARRILSWWHEQPSLDYLLDHLVVCSSYEVSFVMLEYTHKDCAYKLVYTGLGKIKGNKKVETLSNCTGYWLCFYNTCEQILTVGIRAAQRHGGCFYPFFKVTFGLPCWTLCQQAINHL